MKRYRFIPTGERRAASDPIAATERAALLDETCPDGGDHFWHIRCRLDVQLGNGHGRALWERHRTVILAEAEFLSGTRPLAWWRYDAPPGAPQEWIGAPTDGDDKYLHFRAESRTPKATQREQAAWLHSRGFLTPAERKKLPRDWFKPSPPRLEVV